MPVTRYRAVPRDKAFIPRRCLELMAERLDIPLWRAPAVKAQITSSTHYNQESDGRAKPKPKLHTGALGIEDSINHFLGRFTDELKRDESARSLSVTKKKTRADEKIFWRRHYDSLDANSRGLTFQVGSSGKACALQCPVAQPLSGGYNLT
jgi:hypothetical protein